MSFLINLLMLLGVFWGHHILLYCYQAKLAGTAVG